MKIKEGYGYWNTDHYPIGGSFGRAGKGGLEVERVMLMPNRVKNCDAYGYTKEGKQVAFSKDYLET